MKSTPSGWSISCWTTRVGQLFFGLRVEADLGRALALSPQLRQPVGRLAYVRQINHGLHARRVHRNSVSWEVAAHKAGP